jgi:hypothetical protein
VIRSRPCLITFAFLALAVGGCSRGPNPPAPTENLTPTVVGVIGDITRADLPVQLTNNTTFAPPAGAVVQRIKNWPANPANEVDGFQPDVLLLGGSRPDGSWWYEIAGFPGPNEQGCWRIAGGSFDEGDSVRLSSGLRLPKAPGFRIQPQGYDSVQWFPGHEADGICVDALGRALYFDAFIAR